MDRLNTKEAAKLLHYSPWTIRQKASSGEIPFYRKPGGQLLFERSDLEAWLRKPRPKPQRAKANSMAPYKRPDSPYYWIQYTVSGERIQESTRTDVLYEAEQIFKRRRQEIQNGTWRHPKHRRVTMGELIDLYLESAAFRKRAPKTRDFYEQRFVYVRARFGLHQALDLTRDDVEGFIEDRLEEVSQTTVDHDVTALFRVLHWAHAEAQLIPHLPFPMAKLKPGPGEFLGKVLDVEEEKRILAAVSYQRPIVLAALDAGLRKGEILAQLWKHVDLNNNLLKVTTSKRGTFGAGRPIPLTSRLHATLRDLPRDCDHVFTFEGKPIQTDIKKGWYRVLEDADVKIRFHDLRATFQTRLEELSVPRFISEALVGHTRKSVADRYVRPQLPALREAIGRLDGWLIENGLFETERRLKVVE